MLTLFGLRIKHKAYETHFTAEDQTSFMGVYYPFPLLRLVMGTRPTFPSFREYTITNFCSLSTSPITRHSENCAAVMNPVSEPINGSTGSEGCAAAQYVREKGLGGTALNKQMKAPAVRGLSFFRCGFVWIRGLPEAYHRRKPDLQSSSNQS